MIESMPIDQLLKPFSLWKHLTLFKMIMVQFWRDKKLVSVGLSAEFYLMNE